MLPTVAPTPAALALAAERLASLRAALDSIGPTPCRVTDPGGDYRRRQHDSLCQEAGREHCTHLGGGWRLCVCATAHRRVGGLPVIGASLAWDYAPPTAASYSFAPFSLPIPPTSTAAQMAALWNAHIAAEAAKAAATFAALIIPTE